MFLSPELSASPSLAQSTPAAGSASSLSLSAGLTPHDQDPLSNAQIGLSFPCHLQQLITHSANQNPLHSLHGTVGVGPTLPFLSDLHFDSRNRLLLLPLQATLAHAQGFWMAGLLSPLSKTSLPSFLSPTKAGCMPILRIRTCARHWERHVNKTLVCSHGEMWGQGSQGHSVPDLAF